MCASIMAQVDCLFESLTKKKKKKKNLLLVLKMQVSMNNPVVSKIDRGSDGHFNYLTDYQTSS